jgi:hypothetical protein
VQQTALAGPGRADPLVAFKSEPCGPHAPCGSIRGMAAWRHYQTSWETTEPQDEIVDLDPDEAREGGRAGPVPSSSQRGRNSSYKCGGMNHLLCTVILSTASRSGRLLTEFTTQTSGKSLLNGAEVFLALRTTLSISLAGPQNCSDACVSTKTTSNSSNTFRAVPRT